MENQWKMNEDSGDYFCNIAGTIFANVANLHKMNENQWKINGKLMKIAVTIFAT